MLDQDSKDLIRNMETRFKTLMIGSIARFEDGFGYLWAHGGDPQNQSQEDFRDIWEDLRLELLNHGNTQMRLGLDDLFGYLNSNKYDYQYEFKFKNQGDK